MADQLHPIIALIGPSGAGKTTLMDKAVDRMGDKLARIQSFTTRAKRHDADALYYEFITREEVERRRTAGIIVQIVEYDGNYYGTDRPHIEGVLKNKLGLLAVVEYGVKTFTDAGYKVVTVRIEPHGYKQREGREEEDKKRAEIPLPVDKIIVNDFKNGGLEKAAQELSHFLATI